MSHDVNMIIGNKIRLFREQCGLTQKATGKASGYSRSTISNLENGVNAVTFEQILQLSNTFDVPALEFIRDIPDFSDQPNELQPYITKLSLLNPAYQSLICSNIDQLMVIQQSEL